jgi:hypothetical protein
MQFTTLSSMSPAQRIIRGGWAIHLSVITFVLIHGSWHDGSAWCGHHSALGNPRPQSIWAHRGRPRQGNVQASQPRTIDAVDRGFYHQPTWRCGAAPSVPHLCRKPTAVAAFVAKARSDRGWSRFARSTNGRTRMPYWPPRSTLPPSLRPSGAAQRSRSATRPISLTSSPPFDFTRWVNARTMTSP